MVSPFCTLQSSNSLRKSIASLAWFKASCMGRSCRTLLVGWAKARSFAPCPRVEASRETTRGRHQGVHARLRGLWAHAILPTRQHRNIAPLPTLHKSRCLLRRLLPGVAVALGLGLELELAQLLAVAGAVAENLLLAGKVLRRTMDRGRVVPSRRLHGEIGIDQVRARERDEIGAAGGDDGVDLVGGRDGADAHGGEAGVVPDLVGERGLEHAAEHGLGIGDGL